MDDFSLKKLIGIILLSLIIIGIIAIPTVYFTQEKPSSTSIWQSEWQYYVEPGIYAAPEEFYLNGTKYSLQTFIWRDFMPPAPPDGRPLAASIRVIAQGLANFPNEVNISRLWLIDGSSVISTLATEEFWIQGDALQMIFREGPKWGPGINVTVVVKLMCFRCGFYYLKVDNQRIRSTV